MWGYLSPVGVDEVRRIQVDDRVGLFRERGGSHAVVAETGGQTIELGIRDSSVSRKRGGTPPVELSPKSNALELRNNNSTNDVKGNTRGEEFTIAKGDARRLTDHTTFSLGWNTTLRLEVERQRSGRTVTIPPEEWEERFGERDGKQYTGDGISPGQLVRLQADLLLKARGDSPNECLKYANSLYNTVEIHPVEDPDYEETKETLERVTERLEAKVSGGALRGSGLDEEWIDQLDRLAHRVQDLYARGGG